MVSAVDVSGLGIFFLHKPHPFGNEYYHNACCALTSILILIEPVEGKDSPLFKHKEKGMTARLLLRLICSYFYNDHYYVFHVGCCFLKVTGVVL